MERRALSERVHAQLLRSAMHHAPGPRDHLREEAFGGRFMPLKRLVRELKDQVLLAAERAGVVVWTPASRKVARERVEDLERRLPTFEPLYDRLVDERSREVLAELLVYRALGRAHVTLSASTPAYWDAYHGIDARFRQPGPAIDIGYTQLPNYRVPGVNGPISLHTHPLSILNTFVIEQYACRRNGFVLEAAAGETVVDGGGGWGDTALYFADRVGPSGRVHAFEFVAASLHTLRDNLAANPTLASRVDVVEHPIWNRADEEIRFSPAGPGTRVGDAKGELSIRAESVDHLVETGRIRHVDYIKLDVEGAERNAIEGAVKTIRTMRPKLAVCAYHRADDFEILPRAIDATGVRYRFALDHFTTHGDETVLFALPER